MKNLFILILSLTILSIVNAQEFKGLDKSPLDMIEYPENRGQGKWARILYSRPQLKGRAYESLVPKGKIWRMGANESTELTLFVPMRVGETTIDSGSYTMYAIPSEGQMTLIINKATHVWGAYSYNKDLDVARVKVPLLKGDDSLEAFSMIFKKSSDSEMDLHFGWGTYRGMLKFTL